MMAAMRTRPYTPNRHGWTLDRRAAFVAGLTMRLTVTAAAAMVGMSRESAYWLRRQPEAADFRAQWDAAVRFDIGEAFLDELDSDAPDGWSSRRLVRRLERVTERQSRTERPK
jgi:hypothetical protein